MILETCMLIVVAVIVLRWGLLLTVSLGCVVALFLLEVLGQSGLLLLEITISSFLYLVDAASDEDTFALAASFRFDDEHAGWVLI